MAAGAEKSSMAALEGKRFKKICVNYNWTLSRLEILCSTAANQHVGGDPDLLNESSTIQSAAGGTQTVTRESKNKKKRKWEDESRRKVAE